MDLNNFERMLENSINTNQAQFQKQFTINTLDDVVVILYKKYRGTNIDTVGLYNEINHYLGLFRIVNKSTQKVNNKDDKIKIINFIQSVLFKRIYNKTFDVNVNINNYDITYNDEFDRKDSNLEYMKEYNELKEKYKQPLYPVKPCEKDIKPEKPTNQKPLARPDYLDEMKELKKKFQKPIEKDIYENYKEFKLYNNKNKREMREKYNNILAKYSSENLVIDTVNTTSFPRTMLTDLNDNDTTDFYYLKVKPTLFAQISAEFH